METCIPQVAEFTGMPAWIVGIVRPQQESRMGFYVHAGLDGSVVLLKDFVTQEVPRRHSVTGCSGERGQLWHTRLPPPAALNVGHHVVFTTPYVVLDGTERRFLDCIEHETARMSASSPGKSVDAGALLKHGPTANHWNE